MKNLLGFAVVAALSLVVPQFAFAAPAAGDLDQATQPFVLYWPTQASSIEVAKVHDSFIKDAGTTLGNSGQTTHEFSVDR